MFCNEEFIRVFAQDRIHRYHQEALKRRTCVPRPRQDAANSLRWLAKRLEPNTPKNSAPEGGSYV